MGIAEAALDIGSTDVETVKLICATVGAARVVVMAARAMARALVKCMLGKRLCLLIGSDR